MKTGRPWQPLRVGELIPRTLPPMPPELKQSIDRALAEDKPRRVWLNDRYVVHEIDREDGITELSIRRTDREFPRDWRHFQRIKNEICGPEREGCELFPAESRLVDGANQFHIYVLPEGQRFTFGYHPTQRTTWDGSKHSWAAQLGGKQRPLEEMS